MPELTPELLAELRALHEAATRPDWCFSSSAGDVFETLITDGDDENAVLVDPPEDEIIANWDVMVQARNALPALLDAAEKLQRIDASYVGGATMDQAHAWCAVYQALIDAGMLSFLASDMSGLTRAVEFIGHLADERDRLRVEKEDMRQRNALLRKRLDLSPEVIQPRLDILRRLDAAEAENERLRQQHTADRSENDALYEEVKRLRAERDAAIESRETYRMRSQLRDAP
jgi:hypothetical protein